MKQIQLKNKGVALVDDDMFDLLSSFNWRQDSNGYAVTNAHTKKTYLMHRFIVDAKDLEVHHKDNNKLNNQRENLVAVNMSQHSRTKQTNRNVSGFKGIYQDNRSGKWIATITVERKKHYLGSFDCPVDAAKVYDTFVFNQFGPENYFNFPLCQQNTTLSNAVPTTKSPNPVEA